MEVLTYEKVILYNWNDTESTDDTVTTDEVSTSTDAPFQVEFTSDTDSHLYTVGVENDTPLTSAEQSAVYLLEIRNLLLIFLCIFVLFTIYSKLKNTIYTLLGR